MFKGYRYASGAYNKFKEPRRNSEVVSLRLWMLCGRLVYKVGRRCILALPTVSNLLDPCFYEK